jgi:hypothetical protein
MRGFWKKQYKKTNGNNTPIARLLIIIIILSFLLTTNPAQVNAQDGVCLAPFQSVGIPLTELGNSEYIRLDGQNTGFTGGLYPNGSNQRPTAHEQAGVKLANSIEPLDSVGHPDYQNGRIVMVSIGMSNVNAEFDSFTKLAQKESGINPRLLLINGALGGQTADKWVDPQALAWQELSKTLTRYDVSAQQVQVVWIKQTLTKGGDFPEKTLELQADLETIIKNIKTIYPNVKLVYLSSRIYSYTYNRGLSPEPNAYETGFAVKWLIEKQINGDPSLNFDPKIGAVKAPYLSWGPYLWADGTNPRADGLVWLPGDLTSDCTHPSESGKQKVAAMLLDFFKNDSTTRPWFHPYGVPDVQTPVLEITGPLPATATPTVTSIETLAPTRTNTPIVNATRTPTTTVAAPTKTATSLETQLITPPADSPGFFEKIWFWLKGLFS